MKEGECMSEETIATGDALNVERRQVLKSLGLAGIAGLGIACGLSVPAVAAAVDAPGWPAEAFRQKSEADALKALYGKTAEVSDKVTLDLPEIAENGAVVPVSVATSLLDVTSISVLVPENPFTIAASYKIPEGTLPSVSCRIKMAKTSKVVAIVESAGKLYSASKDVKVTLGGCGG
jgi:sulfur-oxidizing protein SoxY